WARFLPAVDGALGAAGGAANIFSRATSGRFQHRARDGREDTKGIGSRMMLARLLGLLFVNLALWPTRLPPQPLEPVPGNARVVRCVVWITVPEVVLHGAQIGALVREIIATTLAQHVRPTRPVLRSYELRAVGS